MVVDDEKDIVMVTKKGLELVGFEVDGFSDPQAAIDHFKPDYYDLVITDIRMPKINGFELYRQITKKDEKIKVAFMTAFEIYESEFRQIFKSIQATLFIKKPIRAFDLAEKLRHLLGAQTLQTKLQP